MATGLPGSFLAVQPLNATALQVVGAASSADVVRANILGPREVDIVSDLSTGPIVAADFRTCGGSVLHVLSSTPVPCNPNNSTLPLPPLPEAVPPGGVPPAPAADTAADTALPARLPGGGAAAGPAAERPACYHSLADALEADPNLTLLQWGVTVGRLDLSDPDLNATLFAPHDSSVRRSLSALAQNLGGQDFLVQAERDWRIMHAITSYFVATEGGLTLAELAGMDNAALPTLLEGHDLTVQANPGPQARQGGQGGWMGVYVCVRRGPAAGSRAGCRAAAAAAGPRCAVPAWRCALSARRERISAQRYAFAARHCAVDV
eukprot:scaffold17.g534.t1